MGLAPDPCVFKTYPEVPGASADHEDAPRYTTDPCVDPNSLSSKELIVTSDGVDVEPDTFALTVPSDIVASSEFATDVPTDHVSAPVLRAMPVPERPSIAARSLERAIVGFPATPSPFVTEMPAAGPVIVRAAAVPAPVRAMIPDDDRAAIASRSASQA